jgi:hypothetical protein
MKIKINGEEIETDSFSFSDSTFMPPMTAKALIADLEWACRGEKEPLSKPNFIFESNEIQKRVFTIVQEKPSGIRMTINIPNEPQWRLSISERGIRLTGVGTEIDLACGERDNGEVTRP